MSEEPMTAEPFGAGAGASAGAGAAGEGGEERAYRIGEVCRLTGTKAFVLRYWETEFPMLAPQKTAKGHRLYRRADVDMVFEIRRLLYEQGFTIAGARRLLETRGAPGHAGEAESAPAVVAGGAAARKVLADLEGELRAILTLLESE